MLDGFAWGWVAVTGFIALGLGGVEKEPNHIVFGCFFLGMAILRALLALGLLKVA
jgi:hypothetical protein